MTSLRSLKGQASPSTAARAGPEGLVEKMDARKKASLLKATINKVGVSVRLLARRFGISKSYVSKVLKEGGIAYRRRSKAPSTTSKQAMKQRRCVRRLSRTSLRACEEVEVVMDDESYFTFSGDNMPETGFLCWPRWRRL